MRSRRSAAPYYEIEDDLHYPRRWHLDSMLGPDGVEQCEEDFGTGKKVKVDVPLRFPLQYKGHVLDFTYAGIEVPVLNERVYTAISPLISKDVQAFEASVEGAPGPFHALNVFRLIDCFDEKRTGSFAKKTTSGKTIYDFVIEMRIDASKVPPSCAMFRVRGWTTPVIVNRLVAKRLQELRCTGIRLREIS